MLIRTMSDEEGTVMRAQHEQGSRRCTVCRKVYVAHEGMYGLMCPHCRSGQDDRVCSDPDCLEPIHATASAGCVSDPTCGRTATPGEPSLAEAVVGILRENEKIAAAEGESAASLMRRVRTVRELEARLDAKDAEIRRLTAALREAEESRDGWAKATKFANDTMAASVAARLVAERGQAFAAAGEFLSPRAGASIFRDVTVTRRVRLTLIGQVERVHPDGKGRGMEIRLATPIQLPHVDDHGPWVRALPPLAGSPDRGRWRVVKWRAGLNHPGDVIVDGRAEGVCAGDSLWLEVPTDG